ncbi:hypothetical protein GCM10023168_26770 [Fodinibacter luteus]|uniref:ATP-binding protein n=1 Tax=Fodinibacter luteus TaxID=552064 RepID=A0ABP8KKK9_9MICO
MTSLPNSFRIRAAEFNRGRTTAFCNNFAAEVLDSIEQRHFDLPVVLRSVPGTGKTSLMQILSAPWLVEVVRRPNDYEALAQQLASIGVLDESGRPIVSGALVNLERDFSSILDIGAPDDAAERIFKRLVDARVLAAHVESARILAGAFDEVAPEFELTFVIPQGRPDLTAILREMGSEADEHITGATILQWALQIETVVRRLLYDLAPFDWGSTVEYTNDFLGFKLLESAAVHFDGTDSGLRPVTFLDDLHRLRDRQRDQIMGLMESRALTRGVWVAERVEVLNPEQLVGGDNESVASGPPGPRASLERGRDVEIIDLGAGSAAAYSAYERMLRSVARKRAATDLQNFADTSTEFLLLLDEKEVADWGPVEEAITERLASVDDRRFDDWILHVASPASMSAKSDRERVADLRATLALIEAEQRKQQAELFLGVPISPVELDRRLSSSVREAALLALGKEYPNQVPVYYGQRDFLALANHNVSQLLRVGADLFDVVLSAAASAWKSPAPTPREQHRTIKTASDRLWKEIPARLEDGRKVQMLLQAVGQFATKMNDERPTSYAPGISGFAMTMSDLRTLLDPTRRDSIPGGDDLLRALAAAVANDYLTKVEDAPRGTRAERRVVFYLNRLLCPVWNLPLGKGGYRTRRLHEVAGWMRGRSTDPGFGGDDDDPRAQWLFDA